MSMEPEEEVEKTQEEAVPKEESAGFMTTVVCGLVILAFLGWIVWLAVGGDAKPNAPKKLSAEQIKMTTAQAAKADPELNAMLVIKRPVPKGKEQQPAAIVKVDVNTASAEQLKKVPGLSEWDVNAIMKRRPYKSLDELLAKKAIGMTRYNESLQFFSVSAAK